MRLVYIYGMPAVGKLTVAENLAKITNFKLFHNHLTADYVSSLFPLRNEMSNKLKERIALIMFEEAAKNNIDLIFTMAHEEKYDHFIKQIIDVIEKYKGEILLVNLVCDKEKLHERIVQDSRKDFGKATTIKELGQILKRSNNYKIIPFKKSLEIDNSNLSARKCAEKIKEFYNLSPVKE